MEWVRMLDNGRVRYNQSSEQIPLGLTGYGRGGQRIGNPAIISPAQCLSQGSQLLYATSSYNPTSLQERLHLPFT